MIFARCESVLFLLTQRDCWDALAYTIMECNVIYDRDQSPLGLANRGKYYY